jgi:retron-type reverse transcriptase
MPSLDHLTALALARALLAGPPHADGLAARMRVCLQADALWLMPLAERCAAMPGELWRRQTHRSLARLIEADPGYRQAWASAARPEARHYLLQARDQLNDAPLGLHQVQRPEWPNSGALCQSLGISIEALWRLTRPAAWQRRAPLGEQHYRFQMLPKRRGGWRLLEVPHPHLMPLQRRVLDDLLDHVPPHEAACGFTRGHSVLHHAQVHAGQPVVLKFDLQDFFSSVPASRVHALFATLGYPDDVARALTALCTIATPEPVLQRLRESGALPWPQAQRLRGAHLPQGAPTSPALANLCAFRLDLRLDGLAHELGARYTRYADDLVFSGPRRLADAHQRIEAWVARAAREEGFALNHRKTRCELNGQRQSVCHIVVNHHPNLPRNEFDRLKAILHQCVLHGPSSQNREQHPDWAAHLRGRVGWAAQLNPAKARKLQRLLDRVDWSL